LPAQWQQQASPPVCKEPEEADAHEAARQSVNQESAKKLLGSERH